jgi:hypothetical protein
LKEYSTSSNTDYKLVRINGMFPLKFTLQRVEISSTLRTSYKGEQEQDNLELGREGEKKTLSIYTYERDNAL